MTAATTHKATVENGPSVIAGRLIWTSASGITTADPLSYGGCLRRWRFEKVGGQESPETDAMRGGTALHAEIENHLKTGVSLQTPLALAGRMFIPHPGNSLYVEKAIHFKTTLGVDIYGHVDLYNLRGEYIDKDGTLQQDPPWSMEVKDWKTTSSFDYCKTERELGENIQLNTYSEAGFRMWPDLEHTRHTHAYFLTGRRPASKLVTIRRSRDEVARRWNYAESVIRTMADASSASSADQVTANTKSCDAYRGCPHREYCSAYKRTSLDNLYSKIADDFKKEPEMGLLASNPHLMQPAAAPAAPQLDMRTQLANEEAQMRAQHQQLAAAAQNPMQAIAAACARIMSHGRGFPTVSGNASQPYSMTLGLNAPVQPGYVFQGQGQLAGISLTEVQHFEQLAKELDDQRAQQPLQVATQALVQAPPVASPVQAPPPTMSLLPPNAPQSMPALAAAAPKVDTYGLPEAPAAEEPKKTRGRPKKTQAEAASLDAAPEVSATEATQAPTPAGAPVSQVPPATVSASHPGVAIGDSVAGSPHMILINARVEHIVTKSLAPYVDYINSELSKRYCVNDDGSPGVQDVRCAPKSSVLAFGGWKGAVREVVKADPPPFGDHHLDTNNDELNEIVADALRVVAAQNGWLYVRGIR